uniref:Uncharacterized protein n=1 Tax=Arundo donax TaxID=35708 RepID=A0A0A8YUB2_ARUDO
MPPLLNLHYSEINAINAKETIASDNQSGHIHPNFCPGV